MTKLSRGKRKAVNKSKASLQLTERDIEIFRCLAKHRVMTAFQIYQLFFPSQDRSQRRMAKLARFKYLHVIKHYEFVAGGGSSPYIYMLDRKGAAEIGATWHHSYKNVTHSYLKHALPINDIMTTVYVACNRGSQKLDSAYKVSSWTTEIDFKKKPLKTRTSHGAGKPITFAPDAHFVVRVPVQGKGVMAAPCFLEWDGTSQSRKIIQNKIKNYTAYFESGDYNLDFSFKTMFVLFVSRGQKRVGNLKRFTEALQIEGNRHFWFSRLSDLTPESIFSKPVWLRAGLTGKHRLMNVEV